MRRKPVARFHNVIPDVLLLGIDDDPFDLAELTVGRTHYDNIVQCADRRFDFGCGQVSQSS